MITRGRLKLSSRFLRLSKEGFWIVLGQALAVLGPLVGMRLITELLTPASYGELALGMTVATLVNQTMLGPLGNGVTRFYGPAQELNDLAAYIRAVRRLLVRATLLIMLLLCCFVAALLIAYRIPWIPITVAAFFLAILSGYNAILSGIQNAARQRSIVALHQGMESWIKVLFALGLLLWFGVSSSVVMAGYAVGLIFVLGSQCLFLKKIACEKENIHTQERNWQEQIWRFSWPFATWGIFYWAQSASDKWALGLFASPHEIGLYSVLFQLGYSPMAMATGMAMQFLSPIVYRRAGDAADHQRNKNVSKVSWYLTAAALGLTSIVFVTVHLFHVQIFKIFVAREYASVSHLLQWMVLASGLFACGQTLSLNLLSQLKPRVMMKVTIYTSILGIAANFLGAFYFGIQGVILAGILFSALYFGWTAWLSRKVEMVGLPPSK